MKYYIDTEFLEGTQTRRFMGMSIGQTKPTIDLISIALVAEDGREYYAISKDFNLWEAWNRYDHAPQTMFEKQNGFSGLKVYWIRENVLKPIYWELCLKDDPMQAHGMYSMFGKHMGYLEMKRLLRIYGKSSAQIAKEIVHFVYPDCIYYHSDCLPQHIGDPRETPPEFYGYYADYDWVAFCWIFGKMMNLPKGFPMYCRDMKQMLDDKVAEKGNSSDFQMTSGRSGQEHNLRIIKMNPSFPKQQNEHNALADARWNLELHKFLNTL